MIANDRGGMAEGISDANAGHVAALTELSGLVREACEGGRVFVRQGGELQVMTRRISVASKKLSCDIGAFTLTESDLALGAAQATG